MRSSGYAVVSYDRRANSRSLRQPAVGPAPIDEQADDAAALLRALDLAPASVSDEHNTLGLSAIHDLLHELWPRLPDVEEFFSRVRPSEQDSAGAH